MLAMTKRVDIDVTFDFRSDTPRGGDPDALSPTLRKYHRALWSKPLPCGVLFELDDTMADVYLCHRSALGEFHLSSDAVVPSFKKQRSLSNVIRLVPTEEWEAFMALSYTMGGMMLFPANRVDGKMTINGARGFHPRIKDRFDFTVECIRHHYRGEPSPLTDTLCRYREFFDLFESFEGYVEFFHLQDLVTPNFSSVRFFGGCAGLDAPPVPTTAGDYSAYRRDAVEFLTSRNARILGST